MSVNLYRNLFTSSSLDIYSTRINVRTSSYCQSLDPLKCTEVYIPDTTVFPPALLMVG